MKRRKVQCGQSIKTSLFLVCAKHKNWTIHRIVEMFLWKYRVMEVLITRQNQEWFHYQSIIQCTHYIATVVNSSRIFCVNPPVFYAQSVKLSSNAMGWFDVGIDFVYFKMPQMTRVVPVHW
eukprot:952099_1